MGPLKSGKAEAVGTDFILPPPGVAFHSEVSINIQIHNCACGGKKQQQSNKKQTNKARGKERIHKHKTTLTCFESVSILSQWLV